MRTTIRCALVFAAALAGPAFGSPIYMQYEGIPGEAAEPAHNKWIEVQSYQWAAPPPAAPHAPSPAGVAVGGPGRLSLVKRVDKASPLLSKAAAAGKVVPVVLVDVPKGTAPGSAPYLRYELKNVMVSSYSVSGQGSGDPVPTESLSLNFTKIEYKYGEQKGPAKGFAPNRGAAAGSMAAPAPTKPAR
jgi:type VI secretion system secreted protein Hcp